LVVKRLEGVEEIGREINNWKWRSFKYLYLTACNLSCMKILNHIGMNVKIGKNVKIWHFTYIGDNTEIGDNTKIGSLVHIDYNVRIGKNCMIEGMVYIPPLTVIEDNVFIGPGVIITNDPYPPSDKLVGVMIKKNAVIGAGAVLKAGIVVGENSVIGMGSIVTKDVPANTVVFGNPAIIRYSINEYKQKRRRWMED